MIAKGQIGADTNVAEMGATSWTRLADIPAFTALLLSMPVADDGRTPGAVSYAGFWIRLLAYIIDVVVLEFFAIAVGIIVGIGLAVAGVLGKVEPPANGHPFPHAFVALFWLVGLVVTIGYNVYFNGGSWQATPGKRILGLHLITTTGEPVSGWLAFGRWAAYALDGLTLYIGFMMIGWTREKTALHDIICATRVVYGKL
jgi:uncharacterized RDD family membrane protein YckC